MTGDCLRTFEDHKHHVYALAFCPDGRFYATGGGDGWLHVYDVKVSGVYGDDCFQLTLCGRQKKSDGLGLLPLRSQEFSRLTGSSLTTPTGWLWRWNLAR